VLGLLALCSTDNWCFTIFINHARSTLPPSRISLTFRFVFFVSLLPPVLTFLPYSMRYVHSVLHMCDGSLSCQLALALSFSRFLSFFALGIRSSALYARCAPVCCVHARNICE
jgi:hypothetical protein